MTFTDTIRLGESPELDEAAAAAMAALEAMRERRRQKRRRRSHRRRRRAILDHYGNTCACCGRCKNLTVDHIFGGGKWHRKSIGEGGYGFYRWLVVNEFPAGFQILCVACNHSKANGESCRLDHSEAVA
jgi:hypothetical protein